MIDDYNNRELQNLSKNYQEVNFSNNAVIFMSYILDLNYINRKIVVSFYVLCSCCSFYSAKELNFFFGPCTSRYGCGEKFKGCS